MYILVLAFLALASPAQAAWNWESFADSFFNPPQANNPYLKPVQPGFGFRRLDLQDPYPGSDPNYGWEHNGQTYETEWERDNAKRYEDNH